MLSHCVFLRVKPTHDPEDTLAVLRALGALTEEVDGMISYSHGPNRDYEGKTADYGFGFVIVFRDRAAHLTYEQHPKHIELGQRLVAMCEGGAAGIAVFDLAHADA